MPNPIAEHMRGLLAQDERGLALGIRPRIWTFNDVKLYFETAANEIDRLEAARSNFNPQQ